MTIRKLPGSQIESNTITITQIQTTAVTNIVAQAGPRANSLIYPGNDTAGNTVGGQTVYINGSGFEPNNAIYINGNTVPSKAFISASNLSFTTPALAAGIYPVYLINTDSGATAIFIPGYISSADPSWVTSASIDIGTGSATWNINLSATGDDPVTYALAGGSSLPSGISLAANGLISGTMSSPPENDTQYLFTVVASDAQNQDASRQFTVTVSVGEGVLFANNVLLIHGDGTNNQNNHTFLDSSNNNFTITRAGNPTQGSFSPFSQTGWSGYFDGTGDYLTVPANTAFTFGTNDFTVEGWFYLTTSANSYRAIFANPHSSGLLLVRFGDTTSYNGLFQVSIITSSASNVYSINKSQSQLYGGWHHFAFTRSGSTCRVFLDGIQENVGSGTNVTSFPNASFSDSTSITSSTSPEVGRSTDALTNFIGYISNLRVLKGTALYTANSSPPTTSLTNIANTSLLTCQSNRFIDNSNNNFAITRNGDVSIQAFSPFAPTAAYSTANVGGSGYFDGTGYYLTVPASSAFAPGTSNFTIEAWVYPTNSSDQYIWTQTVSGTNYFVLGLTTTAYLVMTSSGGGTAINGPASSIIPFAWNHVAAVRSGGTVTVYVNGVAGTPGANALDLTNTSHVPTIGTYTHSTSASPLNSYLASLRYVKGTAVYTSAFTPPTAPLTNIANTSALLNFTNAGIFDQTAKTVLETVGDAKVSTAQYKYGTGSMYFDGTGDYLSAPDNPLLELESGDFTIEAWIYVVSYVSGSAIITKGTVYSPFLIYIDGTSEISFYASTTGSSWAISDLGFATNPATSTWHHIAVTRSGSTVRTFFNGTLANSTTLSGSLFNNSNPLFVGYYGAGFNGYIDDLRITKGYARYTSTFTPPTSALKDS